MRKELWRACWPASGALGAMVFSLVLTGFRWATFLWQLGVVAGVCVLCILLRRRSIHVQEELRRDLQRYLQQREEADRDTRR